MPGPPNDVAPSALFLKLLEPQPSEVVDFPRRSADGRPIAQIRIAVLAQDDHDVAREDAHRKMRAKGFDKDDLAGEAIKEVLGDTVARELLAKACLSVEGADFEDGKPPRYAHVFQTPEQLKKLRPAEIATLFAAFMLVQEKFGPNDRFVATSDDVNKWIVALQEGGSEFPLLRLPLPQLVELAFALAERASLLSRILDSQWSSLPDTCKSRLDGCSMGIGFYGGLAETSTETGGESSADEQTFEGQTFKEFASEMDAMANSRDAKDLPTTALTATPVTTEQAVRLSDELRGKT
jgi:hypothetical protein